MRAIAIDGGYESYDVETATLQAVGARFELVPCDGDCAHVLDRVRDAAALLVRESRVSADVIAAMPNLRAIVRYGIGVDNIALDAARRRHVYVANVPDYGTEEVSDQAMALLLAVVRRAASRDAAVRAGGWNVGRRERMYRIAGCTVGLVGYGRIARAFERKMRGFEPARVLVSDPYLAAAPPGVDPVDLDTLCRESDIVALFAPATPATRHMIDGRRLALMKRTAVVVNTARGSLVDENALADALDSGRLFGAGLDVFEHEPLAHDSRLRRTPNTVLSDHTGWYSEQSVAQLQREASAEVARVLRGEVPRHWLNRWDATAARSS